MASLRQRNRYVMGDNIFELSSPDPRTLGPNTTGPKIVILENQIDQTGCTIDTSNTQNPCSCTKGSTVSSSLSYRGSKNGTVGANRSTTITLLPNQSITASCNAECACCSPYTGTTVDGLRKSYDVDETTVSYDDIFGEKGVTVFCGGHTNCINSWQVCEKGSTNLSVFNNV